MATLKKKQTEILVKCKQNENVCRMIQGQDTTLVLEVIMEESEYFRKASHKLT